MDKSKLDWATEILAGVIRKAGENPDAPFNIEARFRISRAHNREKFFFFGVCNLVLGQTGPAVRTASLVEQTEFELPVPSD
jgi:hypothetical protein